MFSGLDEATARETSSVFLLRALQACEPGSVARTAAAAELERRKQSARKRLKAAIGMAIALLALLLFVLRPACGCIHS